MFCLMVTPFTVHHFTSIEINLILGPAQNQFVMNALNTLFALEHFPDSCKCINNIRLSPTLHFSSSITCKKMYTYYIFSNPCPNHKGQIGTGADNEFLLYCFTVGIIIVKSWAKSWSQQAPKSNKSRIKRKKEGFGPWADTKITWATHSALSQYSLLALP